MTGKAAALIIQLSQIRSQLVHEGWGSFDVHFCPPLTSDGVAHYLKGLSQSRGGGGETQQWDSLQSLQRLKAHHQLPPEWPLPPSQEALCNQSLFLNVPKRLWGSDF